MRNAQAALTASANYHNARYMDSIRRGDVDVEAHNAYQQYERNKQELRRRSPEMCKGINWYADWRVVDVDVCRALEALDAAAERTEQTELRNA